VPVLIATSNAGKLRDFAGAARACAVEIAALPGFASLPEPVEDQPTFALNARKKAEHYSRFAPGALVLADDSGLEVDALDGAPGVHSARYAVMPSAAPLAAPAPGDAIPPNTADAANNARLLHELDPVPDARRTARFVCAIAAARDGAMLSVVEGDARGTILRAPRGAHGFGYDPLFFVPELGKTFAELTAEEKAQVSHRGRAFRKFLEWYAKLKAES
jgi:XTP/dITP diphosphohydrolase